MPLAGLHACMQTCSLHFFLSSASRHPSRFFRAQSTWHNQSQPRDKHYFQEDDGFIDMQSEVYLSAASSDGTSPRTLALRPCAPNRLDQTMSQGQVIYFALHGPSSASASPSSSTLSLLIPPAPKPPTVSVRLAPAAEFHAGYFRKLQSRPVYGCLGLMHHANGNSCSRHAGLVGHYCHSCCYMHAVLTFSPLSL